MASCQPANHKSLLWQESLSQALKASNLFQFQICFISRWSEQSYWFYFNPWTLKLSWMLIINAEAYSGTLALFLPKYYLTNQLRWILYLLKQPYLLQGWMLIRNVRSLWSNLQLPIICFHWEFHCVFKILHPVTEFIYLS